MKICITTSEMSQLQYQLGEGKCKQRSFVVDIPNENIPQGLREFLKLREEDSDFRRYSNIDLITTIEE